MKHRFLPFQYILLVLRWDQFVLPTAVWALFVLLVWMLRAEGQATNIANGFLCYTLPVLAGILAANCVLDDPALELLFAAPRPAWLTLLERLGVVLLFHALLALAFQAVVPLAGIDLSFLGGFAVRQLAWFIPVLGMIALGCVCAFALAQSTFGALVVGVVWLIQLLLRAWFAQSAWGRYLFLFLGAYAPGRGDLPGNQLFLLGLALLLLALSWQMFRQQERYL